MEEFHYVSRNNQGLSCVETRDVSSLNNWVSASTQNKNYNKFNDWHFFSTNCRLLSSVNKHYQARQSVAWFIAIHMKNSFYLISFFSPCIGFKTSRDTPNLSSNLCHFSKCLSTNKFCRFHLTKIPFHSISHVRDMNVKYITIEHFFVFPATLIRKFTQTIKTNIQCCVISTVWYSSAIIYTIFSWKKEKKIIIDRTQFI